MFVDIAPLLQPISGQRPCGSSLEDSQLLLSFDAYRIFGYDFEEPNCNWLEIKACALAALNQSKDLRLLAYLAAAVLRTDGARAFTDTLIIAAEWLRSYWSDVYPLVDEDALQRRSALECLADNKAVIQALYRAPLITHATLGTISFRDIQVAKGSMSVLPLETIRVDDQQIRSIFVTHSPNELRNLAMDLGHAQNSVKAIKDTFSTLGLNLWEYSLDWLLQSMRRTVLFCWIDAVGKDRFEHEGGAAALAEFLADSLRRHDAALQPLPERPRKD